MAALRLMRAFFRIHDREKQRAVIDFVEQTAASNPDTSAVSSDIVHVRAAKKTAAEPNSGGSIFLPPASGSEVIPVCVRCKGLATLMPSSEDKGAPVWRCFKCPAGLSM